MKLVTTEVKKETYTVYDKMIDCAIGTFDDIEELYREMNAYSLKQSGVRFSSLLSTKKTKDTNSLFKINKTTIREYYFDVVVDEHGDNVAVPKYRDNTTSDYLWGFYVTDSLGDIVDVSEMVKKTHVYKYGTASYKHEQALREMIRATLVVKSSNPDKIKEIYAHVESTNIQPRYREDYTEYKFRFYRRYRRIHTYYLHRKVAAVIKDDSEPTFRAKIANTPNTWDDVFCGRWKMQKSWKHNCKRRKQWKDKSNPINNRA